MFTISDNVPATAALNIFLTFLAIWVVASVLIYFLYPVLSRRKNVKMTWFTEPNDETPAAWVGVLVAVITMVLTILFSSLIPTGPTVTSREKVADLVALSTDSNLEGSFFLGTGSVGEERSFIMNLRVTEEDGRQSLSQITKSVDEVKVFESDDVSPEYVKVYKTDKILMENLFTGGLPMPGSKHLVSTEVTIPTGSVVEMYNMDTE